MCVHLTTEAICFRNMASEYFVLSNDGKVFIHISNISHVKRLSENYMASLCLLKYRDNLTVYLWQWKNL